MIWHNRECTKNSILRHLADYEVCQTDIKDPPNVGLGLASDEFNPFGTMQSTYRT